MPRLPPWLALAASAVALAGCGSSATGQSSTPSTGASASSPAALAQAIGLRPGDVPDFELDAATPAGAGSSPLASGACAVQTTGALSHASSPTLHSQASGPRAGGAIPVQGARRPLYTLSSLILVDSEATEAETQLFAAIGAGARACLRTARKTIGSEGGSASGVTVATLPNPAPGLPIYGLLRTECLGLVKACGRTVSEDRYFFAVGRVLVTVRATSSSGAFPPMQADRLLTLLYQRALAHTP
jgi:hypothetical protein